MELNKAQGMVKRISSKQGISIQKAWDILFFGNFLKRISFSKWKEQFIFKGGFLLQNMVGAQARTTMDIDLKLVQSQMSDNELREVIAEICNLKIDEISYELMNMEDIHANTIYGGKTLKIKAQLGNVRKLFNVDIGTGDVVTPYAIDYIYDKEEVETPFTIKAYTPETIIAEKFQTLVAKGTNNSRAKDILDLHLMRNVDIDKDTLQAAIINTFNLRNTLYDKGFIENSVHEVLSLPEFHDRYENFRRKSPFAKDISYQDCCDSINALMADLTYTDKIDIKAYGITLHLLRHGQDDENMLGGWSDTHLTNKGIEQMKAVCALLDNEYDIIVSSDLVRTRESAEIIGNELKKEISYDKGFRETNNGKLRNLSVKEFNELYPGLYYSSFRMDECYPEGESPRMFFNRVSTAFLSLLENNRNKNILLITHGGVITAINCLINGYPYSNKLKITPQPGSLIKY